MIIRLFVPKKPVLVQKATHPLMQRKNGTPPARKCIGRWILITMLGWILAVAPARVVAAPLAQAPQVHSFQQQDLNGDGTPDLAILMASHPGVSFKVLVYDQGLDMQVSDTWQGGTDFDDDIWLFQTDTGLVTKLIIRFTQGPSGYQAELFDDFTGDGNVAYKIQNGNKIDILEFSISHNFNDRQPSLALAGWRGQFHPQADRLPPDAGHHPGNRCYRSAF